MTNARSKASPARMDQAAYESAEKEKLKELLSGRNWPRRLRDRIPNWREPDVPREARGDWLRIHVIHDRIRNRLFESGAVAQKDGNDLAIAGACLKAARKTADLAEAWSYINQGSESLCHVAESEEETELFERIKAWEPILQESLEEIYEQGISNDLKKERQLSKPVCRALSIHSQHWQLVNQSNHLRRKLWSRVTWILMVVFVLVIGASTILYFYYGLTDEIKYPLLWISVFGLLGGALSALLSAKVLKPTAISYRSIVSQVVLRLALGASGAFIVYAVVTIPGILNDKVASLIKHLPAFIVLGIAGGFSERLFKEALDQFAARILPTKRRSK